MIKLSGNLLFKQQLLVKVSPMEAARAIIPFSNRVLRFSPFVATNRLFTTEVTGKVSLQKPESHDIHLKNSSNNSNKHILHQSKSDTRQHHQMTLHKQILRLFKPSAVITPERHKDIAAFIAKQAPHLDTANLVTLFFSIGRGNFQVPSDLVPPLTSALFNANKRFKANPSGRAQLEKLAHKDIGKLFYSLKCFDCGSAAGLRLVRVLTASVRAMTSAIPLTNNVNLSPHSISSMLFGLKDLSSCHVEVRALLKALASFIASSSGGAPAEPLTSRAIGNGLLGFKALSCSDGEEPVALLAALLPRIEASQGVGMECGHIATALLGLKGMDSKHECVRRVLAVLASEADASFTDAEGKGEVGREAGLRGGAMRPKEVCMALHGLANKSSRHEEVLLVLRVLTSQVPLAAMFFFLSPPLLITECALLIPFTFRNDGSVSVPPVVDSSCCSPQRVWTAQLLGSLCTGCVV